MKRLVLLLALLSSAAQAETIVMTCKGPFESDEIFRFKSGFWGLTKAKYEEKKSGRWIPFCTPSKHEDTEFRCEEGERAITSHFLAPGKYGTVTFVLSKLIDFELKQYQVYLQEENNLQKFSCRTVDSD